MQRSCNHKAPPDKEFLSVQYYCFFSYARNGKFVADVTNVCSTSSGKVGMRKVAND